MALNVKTKFKDFPRYFGHELDLIIKNHPFLDYSHSSRLLSMIALEDPNTMDECFDADLLSKVSKSLQNRNSTTGGQQNKNKIAVEESTKKNQPEQTIVSSSSSEENTQKTGVNVIQIKANSLILKDSPKTSGESSTELDKPSNEKQTNLKPDDPSKKIIVGAKINSGLHDKKSETKALESNIVDSNKTSKQTEHDQSLKPAHSKNDDLSSASSTSIKSLKRDDMNENSDSNGTTLMVTEEEDEDDEEEDKIGKKIQYCVCQNKYEGSNSVLCDRCSNFYHVECAGDEEAKHAHKNRKNSRESIPFRCFKCRRNTRLIKMYENELKASGRWDSDCEDALNDKNDNNDSESSSTSGDEVFILSDTEPTEKPPTVKRKPVSQQRRSVEESVGWIKSKCKEPNQTKLVSDLAQKRRLTRTKHIPLSQAAEKAAKKTSTLKSNSASSQVSVVENPKYRRRGSASKSSVQPQQPQVAKTPVLQTQMPLSKSNEEKLVTNLMGDFEKRFSNDSDLKITKLSENELRTLCQTIFNEYKKSFSDNLSKFHKKWTSLRCNLQDIKNKTFYRKILNGTIVPWKLPDMNSADMMDDSLKDEEKRQEEANLRMIINQNEEHNAALIRYKSEVNEKLGFSKLDGIDCDQDAILHAARRESIEKRQQQQQQSVENVSSEQQPGTPRLPPPIEHSNRKKLNSKLEELSEKIAEEICSKSSSEKDNEKLLLVDTTKRASSIPTSLLEKPSDEAKQTLKDKSVIPDQVKTHLTNTAIEANKSTEISKKPIVPSRLQRQQNVFENRSIEEAKKQQQQQPELSKNLVSAPIRQTSLVQKTNLSPSINSEATKSPSESAQVANTVSVSSNFIPAVLKLSSETLPISSIKSNQGQLTSSESKLSPSITTNDTTSPSIAAANLKMAPLISRSLSSISQQSLSPSQVQVQTSPSSAIEEFAKLPQPAQCTEFKLKVFVELRTIERSFCVSTQWNNVTEIADKRPAFSLTPNIVNYLMQRPKINVRPRDGVRDPNVEKIWQACYERDNYLVFEVKPGNENESYQWLNNQYRSELTSDEIIFTTLKDWVEFAAPPHLPTSSKPVKCVKCIVPPEMAVWVDHIYLVWVNEKKGSKKDLLQFRIPLDREQSRLLCLMFLKSSSSTSITPSVLPPVSPTVAVSSNLPLKAAASIEATTITKRKSVESATTSPLFSSEVETKKAKIEPPKLVLRDPRLLRSIETTTTTTTSTTQVTEHSSVFQALKRLFRDIQAGKTEALASVQSLASEVGKLNDAEKLELRKEFHKFDSLRSLVDQIYEHGEDMDICSPEPQVETAQITEPSRGDSRDETESKSVVEKEATKIILAEKKVGSSSVIINETDLLIQQLKAAPTNRKINVHIPLSIKENPKELLKFYEFINGKN